MNPISLLYIPEVPVFTLLQLAVWFGVVVVLLFLFWVVQRYRHPHNHSDIADSPTDYDTPLNTR
jgi:hypothetical protein